MTLRHSWLILVPPISTFLSKFYFGNAVTWDVTRVAALMMTHAAWVMLHEWKLGGNCSQSLSLDYNSIFQSKFMVSEEPILSFVQRVLLLRSMTSLVWLIGMSQYPWHIRTYLPVIGSETDLKPDTFSTSCLAYKPLYYVTKCENNYVILKYICNKTNVSS